LVPIIIEEPRINRGLGCSPVVPSKNSGSCLL
jgi:hypothetical protein